MWPYTGTGTRRKSMDMPGRGRWAWNYSRTYKKDRRRLKSLYRQKAAYTKQSHEGLAGRLLKDSLNFIVEDMPYKSLQKRAGKTGRREEAPGVAQKDGTTERQASMAT